tara:strand:+ start:287 stop:628 length:342 start_codon:yes stop_codon:yes gene_type:complete
MTYYLLKIVITGIIVVLISEVAKINIKLAAVITAMPLITILSIIWMHYEGVSNEKIATYVFNTLKYIIYTIPMFLIFPHIIEKTNFYISLFASVLVVAAFFVSVNYLLKLFNN